MQNPLNSQQLLAEIPRLRRYARALVGDFAGADDLVQDTLERAWARATQWRAQCALRPWLFSIMHNLRIDQIRRHPAPNQSIEETMHELPTRATQTDQLEVAALQNALNQLPEEQRQILLLVTLDDLSYQDIADALNIPLGTVMSRLARGREKLRCMLAEENNTPRLRVVK